MKDLQSELDDLTSKYQDERAALVAKHAVLSTLANLIGEYHPPFVHYHELYGSVGSIDFKPPYASSLQEGKNPDAALFRALLAEYPPVPLVQVKDGCTSFRPAAGAWKGTLTPAYPVVVKVDIFQGHTATFEWYAQVNGALWGLRVTLPLHQTDLGRLEARAKRYPDGRISSWGVCQFYPSHGAHVIRWAAGSREYPNSFTLWWDGGATPDLPSFIKG